MGMYFSERTCTMRSNPQHGMEKIKMSLQKAVRVGPSRIEIAYESFGAQDATPLLLLMGAGAQMLSWHEDFCAELASYHLRPIRFDNRDVGLSTHFHDA